MQETLTKFFTTPGYCTIKELVNSKLFLQDLKEKLDTYLAANGTHPLGATLKVNIEQAEWYINNLNLE